MLPKTVRNVMQRVIGSPLMTGPRMQPMWELLHRAALFGMNVGGGNDFQTSGEGWVIDHIVKKRAKPGQDLVIFDVGANEGHYAQEVRGRLGPDAWIHCFEPSKINLDRMRSLLQDDPRIKIHSMGLGEHAGTATLYGTDPGTVVGTMHQGLSLDHKPTQAVEECVIGTIDDVCAEAGIDRVDLLKLDIEGNEYPALKGAARMIARRAIGTIQFEFGAAQINSRVFFRDIFMLLTPQYRIYRILPAGITPIDHYDVIREVYRTSNYLAIQQG